jgi:cytochrome c oxidase subunit 3
LFLSKTALQKNNRKWTTIFIVLTLILGLGFVGQQYQGFEELKAMGLFFTGPQSEVSSSMLLVIVFAHVLHVFIGVICLLVMIYNHLRGKYVGNDMLGFELGAIFWHFLDLLWVGLFCFFYFNT